MPQYGKANSKGVRKVISGNGTATVPIVRDKWQTDDMAKKQFAVDQAQAKKTPKQGKKFDPQGDAQKKFR